MNVYIVYNTLSKKPWTSSRGRVSWTGPKRAVNAWEQDTGRKFNKQRLIQVHEAMIVRGAMVPKEELQ